MRNSGIDEAGFQAMFISMHNDAPPLCQTDDGVVRISGTRIPLERVIRAFLSGMTPEQICHDFDTLAVKDVYAVITYYLHHRDEIDAYMAAVEKEEERIREEIEQEFDPTAIRSRLLARRAGQDEKIFQLSIQAR